MSLFVIMMISSIFTNGIFVSQAMADGNSTSTQNSTASASLDATSTAITSTQNTVSVGSQITLTATVTDNSNIPTSPAGSIMWNDNNAGGTFSSAFCNIVSGTCTVTYVASSSAHNAATITATYGGDASHQTSSGTYSITVNSVIDSTSVSITSSSSSFVPGNAITLTATVTDTSSSPTIPSGTLSWSDGNAGGVFGSTTCTLSGGMCTTSYTPSSSATNSITMTGTYAGDTTHQTSSGTDQLSQNTQDSTSAVITSSSQSFVIGNAMTVTATITDTSNSQNVPSGTLSWSDGNAGGVFGSTTCTLSSGMCIVSYTPSSGATNSITITGTYAGDSSHQTSSGTLRISQSTQDPTSVVVTAPQSTISAGGQVTVTATVADTSNSQNVPTGTITWNDGSGGGTFDQTSCTLSSNSCTVSYTSSSNPPNAVTITASYQGDARHQTSTGSSSLSANVLHPITIAVTPNPTTFSPGVDVTFTVTVTDTIESSSGIVGLVKWTDNGAGGSFSPDACIITNNRCALEYTPPTNPTNNITITASYGGDPDHSGGSATALLTVNAASSSTSESAPAIQSPSTPQSIPTTQSPSTTQSTPTTQSSTNTPSTTQSNTQSTSQSTTQHNTSPTTQSPSTTQSTPTTQSSTNTPSTTQSNTQSTSQSTSGNPIQQSTSSGKSQQSQQNPEVTISKAISNVVSELETFFKKL
ncbi:MAG: Ig-like domain repeat protein [Thaumarchaeota archaeon]|nr:Ig-like domain repeat protein [Nitrososphaerota archaeon]